MDYSFEIYARNEGAAGMLLHINRSFKIDKLKSSLLLKSFILNQFHCQSLGYVKVSMVSFISSSMR
jgi:hypothetical protein